MSNSQSYIKGYLFCVKCKEKTKTRDPYVKRTEYKSKLGKVFNKFSIKGDCVKCGKEKNRFLSPKELEYLPESMKTMDENFLAGKGVIDDLFPFLLPEDLTKVTALIDKDSNDEGELLDDDDGKVDNSHPNIENIKRIIKSNPVWNEAINNSTTNAINRVRDSVIEHYPKTSEVANKVASMFTDFTNSAKGPQSGEGIIEDAARAATKVGVKAIPIVGQLIPESWVDKACDWIGDNIWQPIKNFFTGGELTMEDINNDRDKFIEQNEEKIRKIAETLLEGDIKLGSGITSNYIKSLRDSNDTEQKTLADILAKTITKPKFMKFLKENNIPNSMPVTEAVRSFIGRNKPYKSKVQKSVEILKAHGYELV
jgi:hypothetical protein